MKRTAILLLVAVVLAWVGSKMVPRSGPTSAVVPSAQEAKAPPPPEKPLSATEKKAQQEKWFGAETIVVAQRAVRASLKDPDSAQFKDVYFFRGKDNIPMTCGQVNSKNSFGGFSGFQHFVSGGSSELTFLENEVKDFYKAWNRYCTK